MAQLGAPDQPHDRAVLTPITLSELVRGRPQATDESAELHAVGSGWAFEDLAIPTDGTLDLTQIDDALPDARLPDLVGRAGWRFRGHVRALALAPTPTGNLSAP